MNFENVWYLPASNTWKDFNPLAMKDIGDLKVSAGCIIFSGSEYNVVITDVQSISYGKQGRDFINNWVKLLYFDRNNELLEAYFADGNKGGWSGIFGGTKKIYTLLNSAMQQL